MIAAPGARGLFVLVSERDGCIAVELAGLQKLTGIGRPAPNPGQSLQRYREVRKRQ